MANWKHVIDISELHDKYERDLVYISTVAKELSFQLKRSPYCENDTIVDATNELDDIANSSLEDYAHEQDDLVEQYDYILSGLYDFGDENHRLFIKTY